MAMASPISAANLWMDLLIIAEIASKHGCTKATALSYFFFIGPQEIVIPSIDNFLSEMGVTV